MKDDHDPMLPTDGSQWRRLEDERSTLRARIDTLRAALSDRGGDAGVERDIAELEQRLEATEQKLERIGLAAEMERQQDA